MRHATPLVSFAALSVLSSLPFAQTALVEEGDTVAGVGDVTSISTLAVNDAGEWLVEVDTDNANTDADAALLADGSLYLREGQALTLPLGATLDSFDAITLNDSGDSGWNFFLDGTTGISDDSGIYAGTQLIIQEGDATTAAGLTPGTPFIGFFETKINDSGNILVMASVDDSAIASSVDRALILLRKNGGSYDQSLIASEGQLLPGQTETVADFKTGPHNFAFNNQGDVMFVADLNGPTSTDIAVYINGELMAQEGSASSSPGRNWSVLSSAEVDLNDACEWVINGTLDGAGSSSLYIEKNGAKFRQSDDTLPAISPFLLRSFGSGPVIISNSSDVLWYGDWDDPDTTVDTGLFVNDELLVQEGVTTIGGVVVDTLRGITDGYTISSNGRYVVFEAVLADGTEGAYMIDRGEVAYQEVRNGSGANALCFKALTTPKIGGAWTLTVDASNHPGATLIVVDARAAALPGTTIPAGELLINLGSPKLLAFAFAAAPGLNSIDLNIPNDSMFIGLTAYVQAAILGGAGTELCNALDATAGN